MKFPRLKVWPKFKKSLKSKRQIAAILVAVVIIFLATRGGADTKQIKLATVLQKPIVSEVSASGVIKSESEATLHFAVGGRLIWVGVKQGDNVWQGQAIAAIDRERFEIAQRQAEQDVNAADAVLLQVYDEQKKQTAAENFDQKIRRTNAEAVKNKAYDAMLRAKRDLGDAIVTAPFEGTILTDLPASGLEVTSTTDIAKIADLGNLIFAADVDETDIGMVKVDQKATIKLDAFGNKSLEATVLKIAPITHITSTGATAFEVDLKPAVSNLKLGMNGEVSIITNEVSGALTIPIEAIVNDKYVWVKRGNFYKQVEIQKGLFSDQEVQVTDGLRPGETVVTAGFNQLNKKSLLEQFMDVLGRK